MGSFKMKALPASPPDFQGYPCGQNLSGKKNSVVSKWGVCLTRWGPPNVG